MPRASAVAVPLTTLLFFVPILVTQDARGDDWPQWRGPSLDGTTRPGALADADSLGLDTAWRTPLGSGYSSVSVIGDLGVTMASMGDRDWVVAFDATSGSERWRFDLGERFLGRSGADDGPMSTPAIGGGLVYALSAEGRFVAIDAASGSERWEHDLTEDFGAEPDFYGYSTAPVIHGERVFLLAGGSEGQMLVAFDGESGAVLWKTGSDRVQHQNLAVTRLGGVEQIVAPGRQSVTGVSTDDGRELWRHEFEDETEAGGVLPIDDHRVLVTRWSSIHLLDVGTDGTARELWSSNGLGRSYSVPVVRGEHLYGFHRRFLTCIDLSTGEVVWRSRPPGGQALIGIDDHLAMVADDGQLVTVAASSEGYRETGRLDLFPRRRVLTPPSFAGDRLFVRDLGEMVAVEVSAVSSALVVASRQSGLEGGGRLVALLDEVSGGGSAGATALKTIESEYDSMPVVEGGRVHFVYRGEQPDLAIVGDMTGAHREVPLRQVGDSDLRHVSFEAPATDRWEYQFKVFTESLLDPRNDTVVETPDGERSVISFGDGGVVVPPGCAGCESGSVTKHEIQSTVPERSYELSVYTPPGYAPSGDQRYPVVFWAEGVAAQQYGDVVAWLDALIGRGEIAPVIGIFLELPQAAWWEQSRERFLEVMVQDVMPFLDREYRMNSDPAARSAIAQGWSAGNMMIWSLGHGVGNVAVQSPFFGEYYLGRDLPAPDSIDLDRLYVDWGSYDQENPDYGLNVSAQSRELIGLLEPSGATVESAETPGGANWTRWSSRTADILRFFHPGDG